MKQYGVLLLFWSAILISDSEGKVVSQEVVENILSDRGKSPQPYSIEATHAAVPSNKPIIYQPFDTAPVPRTAVPNQHTSRDSVTLPQAGQVRNYRLESMTTEQLRWYFYSHNFTEEKILENSFLYLSAAYLVLAKQLPKYATYVERYYREYKNFNCVTKAIGWVFSFYKVGLQSTFTTLWKECEENRKKQEEKVRKQRALQAQQEHEAHTRKAAAERAQAAALYCTKIDALILDEHMVQAVPSEHLHARHSAYNHIKASAVERDTHQYTVAPETIAFAHEYDIAESDLATLHGNTYEQQLHTEFLEQLIEAHTLSAYYTLQPHNLLVDAACHGAAIGMEANRLQQPDTATIWANFGWHALQALRAGGEGLCIWAENTAHMILDPVTTVKSLVDGLGMLVYGSAYVIGSAAGTAIKLNVLKDLEDYDAYTYEINQITDTITALQNYCTEKLAATSNNNIIKYGTVIAADIFLAPKIFMCIGSLCSRAAPLLHDALVHLRSHIPHIQNAIINTLEVACAESPVLQTAEGMLMKASEELNKVGGTAVEVIKHTHAVLKTVHAEYMAHLEVELQALRPLFDNTIKGFAEFKNKFIKIEYKHILGIEELTWKSCEELLNNIKGFHHDFMNIFKKSDVLQFTDQIMYEHGFYKASVVYKGAKIKRAGTFFPAEWSRRKVIEKIQEAFENFVKSGALPRDKGGKYMIDGPIAEGIKIRMYITKNGVLKTAFPLLE